MKKRVILIVLDSLGIGALPDAAEFGDDAVNTLGHIAAKKSTPLNIPHLQALGLAKIDGVDYLEVPPKITGSYARLAERSKGKDTTTGHWEIAGIETKEPFRTFPNGFPAEVIDQFSKRVGREVLYNKPASGTEIIKQLGEKHIKTGALIIYTSADSVFQIAAHEEVVPLEELYRICEVARQILQGEYAVARVIARPFVGQSAEDFVRTSNRRDYSLKPPQKTVLNTLQDNGYQVRAVGKIVDIYNGYGITHDRHTTSNMDGVDQTLAYMKESFAGLIFTNLVDFDAKFGHRRNIDGYGEALEAFDRRLPEIIDALGQQDILMLTADHGNDPSYRGSDHTREYVPFMIYGDSVRADVNLATRDSFADIAATIADIFSVEAPALGKSMWPAVRRQK